LPRRFHGNPLIIPQKVWLSDLNKDLKKAKLPAKLVKYLRKQRKTKFPLLIFASEIKKGQEIKQVLQKYFPEENVGFVASTTENRLKIVQDFRDKKISILVTTTILERGVTFPCVDVIVLEDDKKMYPSYRAGTVVRSEILSKYPELKPVLEKLNNILDDKTMADLNYQVESKGKKPEDVAREYLQEKGLLEVKQ